MRVGQRRQQAKAASGPVRTLEESKAFHTTFVTMTQAAGNNVTRFEALDGWRGICACLVVLFHFHGFSPIYSVELVRNSYLFVDFFFVLSGFVIA
jgi:hypothetical protein